MSNKISKNLQDLSNRELLALEDKILLKNELRSEDRAFFTQSRLVIYFLAILFFCLMQILLSPIFTILGLQNNPLAIFL
jgi:hypothetical protein